MVEMSALHQILGFRVSISVKSDESDTSENLVI